MPRYEFSEGTSNKFWQIDLNGSSFTVAFGRIGSAGQTSSKSFDTTARAQHEYDKLIAEKTKKGYRLVGTAATSAAGPTAAAPPPAAPAAAPAPPAAAPAPPAAAVVMTDAARAEAAREAALPGIAPQLAGDPTERWRTDIGGPSRDVHRKDVQNGLRHGDREAQELAYAVLREYGSDRMPAELTLDTAAAALQLRGDVHPLIGFWVAHAGLAFALDAFVHSQWGWRVESHWHSGARWLVRAADRRLADRFAHRSDRVLHGYWLGATDSQRAAARSHAAQRRATLPLLERSAIASCVLDPAWIDDDLRAHAATGEPAMLSPEALMRATDLPAVATYLRNAADIELYLVGTGESQLAAGYALVDRHGLAGIDVACARVERAVRMFDDALYADGYVPGAQLCALLEVVRLARHHRPAVAAAVAVLIACDGRKLPRDRDPQPLAHEIMVGSPELALPLVQALRRGRAKDLASKLGRLTGVASGDARPEAEPDALPAALRAAPAKAKLPTLWLPAAFSPIALRDGTAYPAACHDALGAVLRAGDRETIAALVEIAEPASLAAFAWDLFQAWLVEAAPPKEKWAFTALGQLGNDETARRLTPLIRAWPGESQHQRAVLGLDVLGEIGSDIALMMLNGIAQKVKFKGLQERAREKMDEIAARRGMTADQLADRLVPDLDLEDDGSKTLDFGPRSFRVGFDETLAPFVIDASGTRLKELPRPGAKDDAALSAAAVETWKAMKKDARTLASIQILRLELGMANLRRWSGEEFRNFFVEHPLMTHLVKRLVWAVYAGDGAAVRTFRVAEDKSYADIADRSCEIAPDDRVGVAHRLHLSDDDADAWGKLFADYELAQPFEQLGRAVYRLDPAERGGASITRFEDRTVATKQVLGLLSRGWRKGPAQDAGWIHELYKPIRPDLFAWLPIEMGLSAASMDYVEPEQELGVLAFGPEDTPWNQQRIPLARIDEVIVSEVIRDVEALGGAA